MTSTSYRAAAIANAQNRLRNAENVWWYHVGQEADGVPGAAAQAALWSGKVAAAKAALAQAELLVDD